MTTAQKLQIFLLVLILGFLTGPRVMLALSRLTPNDKITSPDIAQVDTASEAINVASATSTATTSPYVKLDLVGKGIYVWDISAGKKLYSKNEHNQMPLASVTKMMMAVVAKELLPDNTKIAIRPIDIFTEKMNEKAQSLGLGNTHFRNERGLDMASLTSGAYGSARDMAMLFEYVFRKHPELFAPTTYAHLDLTSENDIVHHVTNTNQDVSRITGIIGSKTGYTDLAGGNLVIVVDIGIDHPVVIAVLGSTVDGRFTDVEQLIDATVTEITGKTITR